MSTEPTSQDYDAILSALVASRGDASGTADELVMSMTRTVQRLAMTCVLTRDIARFLIDEEIDQLEADVDREDRAALGDDTDRAEAIQSLCHQSEEIAQELGYVVTWDGGYSIHDLIPLTPRQRQIVIEGEQLDHCGNTLDDFTTDALSLEWLQHNGTRVEQPEHEMSFIYAVARSTDDADDCDARDTLARLVGEYDAVMREWSRVCEEENANGNPPTVEAYQNRDDALNELAHNFAEAARALLEIPEEN